MKGNIRPGIVLDVDCAPEELGRELGKRLRRRSCSVRGLVASDRIELHVKGDEQHLWSPQLILDVEARPGGTTLRGRFGPHPSVWTLFMAGYATCALLASVGLSFGLAQLTMERPPWGFWGIGAGLGLAGGLSALAYAGQGLGHEQMEQLQTFLEDSLTSASFTHRPSSAATIDPPRSA